MTNRNELPSIIFHQSEENRYDYIKHQDNKNLKLL